MDRPGPQRRVGTLGRRGYRELVALLGLLSFGSSIASSFWVVYLAGELGLPSALIASLYAVGLFVAAFGAMMLTRVRSVHATRTMIAGIACLAATQLALAFLRGPALHVSFAVLFGAYIPLFFLPWNVLLTSETQPHDRGAKFGGINLAFSLASVAAPLVGGLLAARFGFQTLFLVSSGILALAAIVTAVLAQPFERVSFGWAPTMLGRGTTTAFLAQGGIDGVLVTAIPLATFSFVTGKTELGALFALFALSGGLISVILGRISDRIRRRRRFIALGVAISVPTVLAVGLAPILSVFAVSNGALSATLAIAPTFVTVMAADRLVGQPGALMATREILLNLSRGSTSVLVLVGYGLGVPAQLMILLVAVLLPFELFAS